MASCSPSSLVLILSIFTIQTTLSAANLHKTNLLLRPLNLSHTHHHNKKPHQEPLTFFEVTKPLRNPSTEPCFSALVLQHDFGDTISKPPITAPYTPPSAAHCLSPHFSKIVLEWSATCRGRQFDRIFGVWLGGVELLRSCTAEPTASGIAWTVQKDVTRYASLLSSPNTLAVYLGNVVDSTYTGVYHVNISLHFYPSRHHRPAPDPASPADLILPVSRNLPLNDGQWFSIQNSTDVQGKEIQIPGNVYRAVLEVYVSFHSDDEFWYTNPPEDYIIANNLNGTPGNGAFREVVVRLDDATVGAIWPFTVIYTGGVNPLLWRPISGIGSFDLPSYDIEITPFLGSLLDGKSHKYGFSVTNALDVWFVDANLHLWLDGESERTEGTLIRHNSPPLVMTLHSNYAGLDGTFLTRASRWISSTGWVKSSHGKIITHSFQGFEYQNHMVFGKDGNLQIVNQTIGANYSVYANHPSSNLYSIQVFQRFPLYLCTENVGNGNGSSSSLSNISFGFNEKRFSNERLSSYLKNIQKGQGQMNVEGHLVTSGLASTQQEYKYESTDDCYFRDVSAKNYSIVHDKWWNRCNKKSKFGFAFGFGRRMPLAADTGN